LLTRALTGDFNEHHAFMIASMLRAIAEADNRISRLSEEIHASCSPCGSRSTC
jgi:transposase